jgi:bacterioferritin-associated ferredoxin
MLDRKTTGFARPALSAAAEIEVPHRKAFDAYLRNGDDDGLRGLVLEGKGLNTQVAAEGGYLVDPQTADTIRSVLTSTASLRAIANVVQVEATSFDVLVDHGDVGSGCGQCLGVGQARLCGDGGGGRFRDRERGRCDRRSGLCAEGHDLRAPLGAEVRAGFEFDVPVRFDTDRIQTSVASFQAGEVPSVPVLEVRL